MPDQPVPLREALREAVKDLCDRWYAAGAHRRVNIAIEDYKYDARVNALIEQIPAEIEANNV